MAMVCPTCAATYEQRLQCPVCAGRLQYREVRTPRRLAPPRWQHTPWGRVLIGLLLARGLFFGLRHLATGAFLAARPPGSPPDETEAMVELVVIQALEAAGLVAGALLAGSGQRNGAALGAVVGVWNGVFAGLVPQAGQHLSAVALYGQPLLETVMGGLAGWLGGAVWKPLPADQPRGQVAESRKPVQRPRVPFFSGQVARTRVALGAAAAIAGTLSATALFNVMVRLGDGGLAGNGTALDQLVTWEIKCLALLAGGAIAGFNTRNGLKQGLCVGVAAALVLAALEPRPPDRWMQFTSLLLVRSLCLCSVGGWFGGQLFPPLLPFKRRSTLGPASLA